MALAGALQVNTMLEELDLGETDQVAIDKSNNNF